MARPKGSGSATVARDRSSQRSDIPVDILRGIHYDRPCFAPWIKHTMGKCNVYRGVQISATEFDRITSGSGRPSVSNSDSGVHAAREVRKKLTARKERTARDDDYSPINGSYSSPAELATPSFGKPQPARRGRPPLQKRVDAPSLMPSSQGRPRSAGHYPVQPMAHAPMQQGPVMHQGQAMHHGHAMRHAPQMAHAPQMPLNQTAVLTSMVAKEVALVAQSNLMPLAGVTGQYVPVLRILYASVDRAIREVNMRVQSLTVTSSPDEYTEACAQYEQWLRVVSGAFQAVVEAVGKMCDPATSSQSSISKYCADIREARAHSCQDIIEYTEKLEELQKEIAQWKSMSKATKARVVAASSGPQSPGGCVVSSCRSFESELSRLSSRLRYATPEDSYEPGVEPPQVVEFAPFADAVVGAIAGNFLKSYESKTRAPVLCKLPEMAISFGVDHHASREGGATPYECVSCDGLIDGVRDALKSWDESYQSQASVRSLGPGQNAQSPLRRDLAALAENALLQTPDGSDLLGPELSPNAQGRVPLAELDSQSNDFDSKDYESPVRRGNFGISERPPRESLALLAALGQ